MSRMKWEIETLALMMFLHWLAAAISVGIAVVLGFQNGPPDCWILFSAWVVAWLLFCAGLAFGVAGSVIQRWVEITDKSNNNKPIE